MAQKLEITEKEYERIYTTYARLVSSCVVEFESDTDNIEALCQDIWTAVWAGRESFNGDRDALAGWIYKIARNICQNYMRDNVARAPNLVSESDLDGYYDEETDDDASWMDQHAVDYESAEVSASLEDILEDYEGLTITLRQVTDLVAQGRSYAEIADALGVSEISVRVYVNRAKAALRA